LEARRVPIGVVQSIVGLGGATVTFTGRADHAGTTPMTMRRDPTRATGEFLTRLAGIAASVSEVAVITCGRLSFSPGGSNVVPHQAELTLDFRAPVAGDVDALSQAVIRVAGECAAMHGVESDVRLDQPVRPVEMNAGIRDHIQAAADECGLPTMALPSGAGHDSQNLARIAPTGMIFVPSHNGRSHSRFEYTDPDLLEQGANVLMATLLRLAG
jgi:N-carbamoyl-L-amino-acid hydrolase